jgi:hypothetical protein
MIALENKQEHSQWFTTALSSELVGLVLSPEGKIFIVK